MELKETKMNDFILRNEIKKHESKELQGIIDANETRLNKENKKKETFKYDKDSEGKERKPKTETVSWGNYSKKYASKKPLFVTYTNPLVKRQLIISKMY